MPDCHWIGTMALHLHVLCLELAGAGGGRGLPLAQVCCHGEWDVVIDGPAPLLPALPGTSLYRRLPERECLP